MFQNDQSAFISALLVTMIYFILSSWHFTALTSLYIDIDVVKVSIEKYI